MIPGRAGPDGRDLSMNGIWLFEHDIQLQYLLYVVVIIHCPQTNGISSCYAFMTSACQHLASIKTFFTIYNTCFPQKPASPGHLRTLVVGDNLHSAVLVDPHLVVSPLCGTKDVGQMAKSIFQKDTKTKAD